MKIAGLIFGIVVVVFGAIMMFVQSDTPAGVATEDTDSVKQVVLPVEGMTCAGCAVSVKMALKDLDGVKESKVDVEKGQTTVIYKDGKVTVEQMIEAINTTGFTARKPGAG